MAWVKVPPENHPIFMKALPKDPRVETMQMFGGVAAKVNGNVFAGLFGLSVMVYLAEPARAEALALPGAAPFDPMGDGRARSDKVMLPARMMRQPAELKRWIKRAFDAAATLPAKTKGAAKKAAATRPATKKAARKRPAVAKAVRSAASRSSRSPRR